MLFYFIPMKKVLLILFSVFQITVAEPVYNLSWKTEIPLGIAGTSLFAIGQWRLSQSEPYQEGSYNRDDLFPWDRPFAGTWNPKADLASNILIVGGVLPFALSIPMWRMGELTGTELGTQLVMFMEVIALQSGVNLMVRSAEVWPRPFMFGSGGGKERNAHGTAGSFYSGHSSAAFSIAVFSSTWFQESSPGSSWIPWVWTGSLAVASTMAGLRVAAGKHYPTDVVVGAIIGSGIGWVVPLLHKRNSPIKIAPQAGGAIAYYQF